jgi:REP element-mobilizing transposase RayT
MARLARVVAPLIPHHVTQRGNRRQQVFFTDDDYRAYLDLLGEHTRLAEAVSNPNRNSVAAARF